MKRLGLDIGSTTVKCIVTDENGAIVFSEYERHYSKISDKASEMLKSVIEKNE